MNLRNLFSILVLVILAFFIVSSCASKRYTKKAVKFEEAGLYEDASDYYYEAIIKKASNVEAKLGLRKTGQQTLEKKLKEVKNAYKQADYEEVVYHYLDAEAYMDKVNSVGVDLTLPEIYDSYYDEAKNDFLNTLYINGIDKLTREEFKSAQMIFQEIISVEPYYKDVAEKYIVAKFEPIYRNANIYFENELYRSAYYTYDEILRETGNYKQALSLKNEAREKGTISILVTDFGFASNSYKQTANIITSDLKGRLIELNNPFITIIDDATVSERIYKNGKLNMQAANLLGIKAILSGKVLSINKRNGKQTTKTKRGYIKEMKKSKNSEGQEISVPEYKKTEYKQYHAENIAGLQVDFTLVSTVNSKVTVSELYKLNNTDEVNYIKFDGKKTSLIPGYWKSRSYKSNQDVIEDNWGDVNALRKLMNAKRNIKSASTLLDELMDESVKKIVVKVNDYNPE